MRAFLYFLFLTVTFSQTMVEGVVIDSNGLPVPYVTVTELPENDKDDSINWYVTNQDGLFNIAINDNSKIKFDRIGFNSIILESIKDDFTVVVLSIDSIQLDDVNVFAKDNINYLTKTNKSGGLGSFSRNGSLNQVPSLILRTYGGYAGNVSASFDAGFARHTKVIYNDFDLTSSQNGLTDLSMFPSFVLNSINYKLNSGVRYGSGSIDGTLELDSRRISDKIFYSFGSYGLEQFGSTYVFEREKSKRTIIFGKTDYEGNYKFHNTASGEKEDRQNNYLDQSFIAMERQFIINDDLMVNINSMTSSIVRGVPGSLSFPSLLATKTNEHDLYSLSFIKFFKSSSLKLFSTRITNEEEFDDPNESYPILSVHELSSNKFGLDWKQRINESMDYQLIAEKKSDRMDSTDLSNQEIDNTSALLHFNYINKKKLFKLSPSIRFDKQSSTKKETYNFGTRFVDIPLANSGFLFDITINAGSAFQFPTMNDLFWPDGLYSSGNPDLEPEDSNYMDIKFISNNSFGEFIMGVSTKDYNNLISWQPDENFKYSPINISSASRSTINLSYLKRFKDSILRVSYNMYDSNDDEIDKSLLYVPDFMANIFYSVDFNQNTSLVMNYRLTGQRIAQYESSFADEITAESYGILNIAVDQDITIKENNLKLNFVIDNLFDEKYESTIGYPEPGRSFQFAIEYYL